MPLKTLPMKDKPGGCLVFLITVISQNQTGAAELLMLLTSRETENKTSEGNAVIKRSSLNISEPFNVANRKTVNTHGCCP